MLARQEAGSAIGMDGQTEFAMYLQKPLNAQTVLRIDRRRLMPRSQQAESRQSHRLGYVFGRKPVQRSFHPPFIKGKRDDDIRENGRCAPMAHEMAGDKPANPNAAPRWREIRLLQCGKDARLGKQRRRRGQADEWTVMRSRRFRAPPEGDREGRSGRSRENSARFPCSPAPP